MYEPTSLIIDTYMYIFCDHLVVLLWLKALYVLFIFYT